MIRNIINLVGKLTVCILISVSSLSTACEKHENYFDQCDDDLIKDNLLPHLSDDDLLKFSCTSRRIRELAQSELTKRHVSLTINHSNEFDMYLRIRTMPSEEIVWQGTLAQGIYSVDKPHNIHQIIELPPCKKIRIAFMRSNNKKPRYIMLSKEVIQEFRTKKITILTMWWNIGLNQINLRGLIKGSGLIFEKTYTASVKKLK